MWRAAQQVQWLNLLSIDAALGHYRLAYFRPIVRQPEYVADHFPYADI